MPSVKKPKPKVKSKAKTPKNATKKTSVALVDPTRKSGLAQFFDKKYLEENDFASVEDINEGLRELDLYEKIEEQYIKEELTGKKSVGRPKAGEGRGRHFSVDNRIIEKLKTSFDGGETVAEVSARLGISKKTFYSYMRDKDFLRSYEIAITRSEAKWSEEARKACFGKNKDVNTTLMIFMMQNLFRDSYRSVSKDHKEDKENSDETIKSLANIVDNLTKKHKKDH